MTGPDGDPDHPLDEVQARMRREWDARARENAEFYINTTESADFEFALSGARDAAAILESLQKELRADMRLLDIGCGIGRLLQFFALLFEEVHGIDIAPTMVERGRAYLTRWPRATLGNVRLHLGNGRDLSGLQDDYFDVAISSHVFQHVPDRAVIDAYIRDTWRVLRPGGLFKFLVKTGRWPGQGEEYDTWHGVEMSLEDHARWLGQRPWRARKAYDVPNLSVAWVELQK